MTRNLLHVSICVLLTILTTTTSAQKLSVGEYTGINFSNLHGYLTSNKWEPKAGPSAGFFAEYSLGRLFSVQTEVNFLTQYYEMKSYRTFYDPNRIYPTTSSFSSLYPYSESINIPYYVPNSWDFSFLRFPLILKYKTPTRLQLGIGGGMFYSVLMNDDLTKKERDAVEKEDHNIYPPTHDWGYLFTTDLSYPVTGKLQLFLAGRLSFGQKVFIENYEAKNGASELLFGIKYSPGKTQTKTVTDSKLSDPDSLLNRSYLKPVIGAAMSWNSARNQLGNYSEKSGANSGLIFGYRLDKTVSLESGFLYQQNGYAFTGTSHYNHRNVTDAKMSGNRIDSQVNFDYLTVPLNLNFSFENRLNWYFDLGMFAGFILNASCTGTSLKEYQSGSSYRLEKYTLHDAVEGYYKTVDWGYSAGLGFWFPISGNTKLDIGIHYQQGLKNMLKKPGENEFKGIYDDRIFKNSSLSLQVGLLIPIHN